jgi:hypothetical protein
MSSFEEEFPSLPFVRLSETEEYGDWNSSYDNKIDYERFKESRNWFGG